MNAFDFSKEVVNVCSKYVFVQGIEIQLLDEPVAKIKAVLGKDTFFNIFFNAETTKYSFALIKNGKKKKITTVPKIDLPNGILVWENKKAPR